MTIQLPTGLLLQKSLFVSFPSYYHFLRIRINDL